MKTTSQYVIYNSTTHGYLTAAAAGAEPWEFRSAHFSGFGVDKIAVYPDREEAENALSGLESRFEGHRLAILALDKADPVMRIFIRRPGNTAWCEMPTLNMRRARAELARANDVVPGHRIIGERESGATLFLDLE